MTPPKLLRDHLEKRLQTTEAPFGSYEFMLGYDAQRKGMPVSLDGEEVLFIPDRDTDKVKRVSAVFAGCVMGHVLRPVPTKSSAGLDVNTNSDKIILRLPTRNLAAFLSKLFNSVQGTHENT